MFHFFIIMGKPTTLDHVKTLKNLPGIGQSMKLCYPNFKIIIYLEYEDLFNDLFYIPSEVFTLLEEQFFKCCYRFLSLYTIIKFFTL